MTLFLYYCVQLVLCRLNIPLFKLIRDVQENSETCKIETVWSSVSPAVYVAHISCQFKLCVGPIW